MYAVRCSNHWATWTKMMSEGYICVQPVTFWWPVRCFNHWATWTKMQRFVVQPPSIVFTSSQVVQFLFFILSQKICYSSFCKLRDCLGPMQGNWVGYIYIDHLLVYITGLTTKVGRLIFSVPSLPQRETRREGARPLFRDIILYVNCSFAREKINQISVLAMK